MAVRAPWQVRAGVRWGLQHGLVRRRLALRPLLPHERTCEDVQQQVVPPSP